MVRLSVKQNIILIAGLFLSLQPIFSQSKICEFSNSLVDSSYTNEQKALATYEWIVNNMKYDLKAYLEYQANETSVDKICKSKKGVCYEFALLYNTMCNCLDLETFLVLGYTDDPNYYDGKQYLRAKHAWSAVKLDSTIALIDPTWGTGYLKLYPGYFQRLTATILMRTAIPNKIRFVYKPTNEYFDVAPKALLETHLPLNPAWQLMDYPITYQAAIYDTARVRTTELNYMAVFNKPPVWEAQKGYEYNPLNNYDIAKAQTDLAIRKYNSLPPEKDSSYIEPLKSIQQLSNKAYDHALVQKENLDSLYKLRKKNLKNYIKKTSRLESKLKSDRRKQRKLNTYKKQRTRNNNIRKIGAKAGKYYKKQSKLENQELKEPKPVLLNKEDSLQLLVLGQNLKEEKYLIDSVLAQSDEMLLEFDKLNNLYYQNNIELSKSRRNFQTIAEHTNENISLRNDTEINNQVDEMKSQYDSSNSFYYQRRESYYSLMRYYSQVAKTINTVHTEGRSELNQIKTAYRQSNGDKNLAGLYDSLKQTISASYDNGIILIDKMVVFKKDVNKARKQDKSELNILYNSLKRKLRNLNAYYTWQQENNETEYQNEKALVEKLKQNSRSIKRAADRDLTKLGVE